jgi:hypothetical protein
MLTTALKKILPASIGISLLLLVFTVILLLPRPSQAGMDEGRVRAAVIFHIISLTQWPQANGDPVPSSSIIVLGQDTSGIADILNNKIKETTSANRTLLRVTSLTTPGEITTFKGLLADCQILYLTQDGMQYLPQLAPIIDKRPILTIGETVEFCEKGPGMICITIESQKLAIHINYQLTSDNGFHFSAELLRHAVLVNK